jgi:hypothetical protein
MSIQALIDEALSLISDSHHVGEGNLEKTMNSLAHMVD